MILYDIIIIATFLPFDTLVRLTHKVLFSGLVLFGIIEGSITTWLAAKFDENSDSFDGYVHDRVGFLTFASWWSVFFCFMYGILFDYSPGEPLHSVRSHVNHVVFLFLTWIFWTAGVAPITTYLGGSISCSTTTGRTKYCNQLTAAKAFAWVEWILTTVVFAMVIICGIRALRSRGNGALSSPAV